MVKICCYWKILFYVIHFNFIVLHLQLKEHFPSMFKSSRLSFVKNQITNAFLEKNPSFPWMWCNIILHFILKESKE